MKITVGQLKKVIHSQLAEAKTAKQGEVKKINEAVKMNIEQPYSNLYIKGWGMDANGNKTIIVGFPNDRGFPIQTNGTLPNTHHIISKAHKELSSDELAAVGKEITAYVSAHGSANQKSRLRTRSGTNESRKPSRNNVADYNQHHIAVDTVKNPNKSMFGGPSAEESEEILRNKFGYTDREINRLKGTNESRISGEVKKINEVSDTEKYRDLSYNGYKWVGVEDGIHTFSKQSGNGFYVIECTEEQLSNGDIEFMTERGITLSVGRKRSEQQKSKRTSNSEVKVMEVKSKGEVKKINEATFTKLIKKLIVEETEAIKGAKLNESITEANTGSESIADKLFRQCMIYPDIIDPIQRIEIFGIIAKKLQDHALLLSKKYARDAKI